MSIYERKIYGVLGYYEFKKRKLNLTRVKFFETKNEIKTFKEITGRNDYTFQCKLFKSFRKKENVLKIKFGSFNNTYIALGKTLYKYENCKWIEIPSNSIAERFMETYKIDLV